jgi:predicted RNA-binding protein associated with RNAse of E/G family
VTEPKSTVTVRKLDAEGVEVFHYSGTVLHRTGTSVVLEAIFDIEEHEFHGLVFRRGDRFVETHYTDRWYNVLAVHDVDTGDLKGWYCNISRPAQIEDAAVSAEDLALDLVVLPNGSQFVLDEDEFASLDLGSADRASAWAALKELQQYADALDGPFDIDAQN